MEEENKDVNVEETPEVTEDKSEETPSESSTDKADKSVPYARFKEVNDQLKEMKSRIDSLQTKEDKGSITPEEKKELDAKNYLKNLFKEVMTEEEKMKSEKEKQESVAFNKEIDSLIELHPDIKRADFVEFIDKNSDKYGIQSVKGAMALYKDLNNIKTSAKEAGKKEIINKPKFPSSDSGMAAKPNYDIKGKSLHDIAREAAEELASKT